MRWAGRRSRGAALIGVLMATTALTAVVASGEGAAQTSRADDRGAMQQPGKTRLAQAAPAQRSFDIPAQPLADALTQFGRQSGMQVSVDAGLIRGISSPGVGGSMPPEHALRQLLAGTGIGYRLTGGDTAMLERLPTGGSGVMQLDPVMVEGKRVAPRQAEIGNLPPAYAGGQVATGGKLGIFGNRDMMDTPFNQTSYTAELMQNQHVAHIADVLNNDPTAHANGSTSTGADDFSIRGFYVGNTDLLFNGMAGVAPTFFNSMMAESIERVEVLKGPNALLNGVAPNGSVGGAINMIPKRAGDAPLIQFTPSYTTDSQLGGHIDVGRRFGADRQFGVRFNGVYRNGDTPIDYQSRESRLAALGLDYRGEKLRVAADLGYQEQDFQGIRDFTSLAAGVPLPDAPDNTENYDGPHDFSNPRVYYGTFRAEYDLLDQLTAFAAVGGSERNQQSILVNRTIIDGQGDLSAVNAGLRADKMYSRTLEAGLRSRFDTGAFQHQVALVHTWFNRDWRRISEPFTRPASNIYNPVFGPNPDLFSHPDPDDARKASDLTLSGTTLADTVSILDERVQLTIGGRLQKIESTNFNTTTGAVTSSYEEDKITPLVGLIVKPWQRVSLYANYIQGLQQGPTAPLTAVNAGEIFPPFVTEQYEIGAKVDFGRIATTLALYQIAQPNGFVDPVTNIFGIDGEQRHRGVDLNVFGELVPGVRLLGGAAFINSELTQTADGVNEGNRGAAVPEWRLVLGAEWDTPFIRGLTLSARTIYNGSMYLNTANTQEMPDWARVDIGARYRLEWAFGKPVTIRANVQNVLDASYWDANSFGQLTLSDPMTFSLSATFDF